MAAIQIAQRINGGRGHYKWRRAKAKMVALTPDTLELTLPDRKQYLFIVDELFTVIEEAKAEQAVRNAEKEFLRPIAEAVDRYERKEKEKRELAAK